MASTGISNFDNESASDYISDVLMNGYGMITIAIERMFDDRPGLVECEEAVIAAEFIAAVLGRPASDFPEEALEWVSENVPKGSPEYLEITGIGEKAADALDLIVTNSELRELWEDQPDYNDWFQAQVELQQRILR